MLAVVELGGNQFIVREKDTIEVKKLDEKVGAKITVPVLLASDEQGKETKIGNPSVEGVNVEFKVLDQFKGEKVRVFKMKSKKRYTRNKGFRPSLTKLEVVKIG